MNGKHVQKKLGAVGTMPPNALSLKPRGRGGGWGYKDRAQLCPKHSTITVHFTVLISGRTISLLNHLSLTVDHLTF